MSTSKIEKRTKRPADGTVPTAKKPKKSKEDTPKSAKASKKQKKQKSDEKPKEKPVVEDVQKTEVEQTNVASMVVALVDEQLLQNVEESYWNKPSNAPHAKTQRFAQSVQAAIHESGLSGSCISQDAKPHKDNAPAVGDIKFSKLFVQAIAAHAEMDLCSALVEFRKLCEMQGRKTLTMDNLNSLCHFLHSINVDATHYGTKAPDNLLRDAFENFTTSYVNDKTGNMHPRAVAALAKYIRAVDGVKIAGDEELEAKCLDVLVLDVFQTVTEEMSKEHGDSFMKGHASAYKTRCKDALKPLGIVGPIHLAGHPAERPPVSKGLE